MLGYCWSDLSKRTCVELYQTASKISDVRSPFQSTAAALVSTIVMPDPECTAHALTKTASANALTRWKGDEMLDAWHYFST